MSPAVFLIDFLSHVIKYAFHNLYMKRTHVTKYAFHKLYMHRAGQLKLYRRHVQVREYMKKIIRVLGEDDDLEGIRI